MTTEEIKEKYDIEPIMREMWVWDDDVRKAKLDFVFCKENSLYPYFAKSANFRNASETNPKKTKEPKVGDVGYFWSIDIKKGYTYGTLNAINFNHWPFVCDSGVSFTHFSHKKQPWMK